MTDYLMVGYESPITRIQALCHEGFICMSGTGSIDGMNWGDDGIVGDVEDIEDILE